MRKLVYTAFVMFWAAISTLLALHWLAPGEPTLQKTDSRSPSEHAVGETTTPTFILKEVARHNRLDDCWMAIEGVVYDLTEYVPRHPTRDEVLEPWCGTEATVGMRTKGESSDLSSDHSSRAWRMLERYRIGVLADQ